MVVVVQCLLAALCHVNIPGEKNSVKSSKDTYWQLFENSDWIYFGFHPKTSSEQALIF